VCINNTVHDLDKIWNTMEDGKWILHNEYKENIRMKN
jgi:hypothetical protein